MAATFGTLIPVRGTTGDIALDERRNRLYISNLAAYRAIAIQFLNTASNGVTPSAFSALRTTTTEYENRIRGMVSFLMTTQRFQEQ